MQIINEPVRQRNPFTSCGSAIIAQQSARDEIARKTAEFLASGGHKTVLRSKGDIIPDDTIIEPYTQMDKRNKRTLGRKENSPLSMFPGGNRAARKSKWGQCIRAYSDQQTFWVQIGAVELGRGEKWSHREAIGHRDKFLIQNNMPAADY